MADVVKWFLLVEILGWITFPIVFNIFKRFRDRGFSISKVFAMLFWGYIFWIGNSFQILNNDRSGAIFSIILIIFIALYQMTRTKIGGMIAWIKGNLSIIIFYEAVFLIGFFAWSFVRASYPAVVGTEKPMEQAFIMGIYRSPTFPPADPWLSGYSISYYYFGYLIVAMMMHVLGTSSGIAFNLAISLWFAMIVTSASGISFNLFPLNKPHIVDQRKINNIEIKHLFLSLLAPFFILIVSNAEGLLEMLHSAGIFWHVNEQGNLVSDFWKWLDIQELVQPPVRPLDWIPSRVGGTWWWRASRVLQDYTASGMSREIIDEFPFFSFYLADFHPHLISIPFCLLALYLSLYLYKNRRVKGWSLDGIRNFWFSGIGWFTSLVTGSLLFINTWDFPIYFGIILSSLIVPRILESGWERKRIWELFRIAVPFGIICIGLYLPFLLGLSSQAGGFLPSLVFQTRGIHYLIMFFPLLPLIAFVLIEQFVRHKLSKSFFKTLGLCVLIAFFLFSLPFLILLILNTIPGFLEGLEMISGMDFRAGIQMVRESLTVFLRIYQAQSVRELITQSIQQMIVNFPLKLFLVFLIAAVIVLLFTRKNKGKIDLESNLPDDSQRFIYILVLFAALLSFVPELLYLRDQFGWRMNTIFKFYFQVWILFSIVASYFLVKIWTSNRKKSRILVTVFSSLAVLSGLVYPCFALRDRIAHVDWRDLSLDGNQYIDPEEYEAIEFLKNSDYGVVSEAIGGSYSSYGRVSKLSGLPTVLGWPGHELQWRGGTEEIGTREMDIKDLYSAVDWDRTVHIINQYDIRYIYVGNLEKNTYSVEMEKFLNHLPVVFNNTSVTIFLNSDD